MVTFGIISTPQDERELVRRFPWAEAFPGWLLQRFPRELVGIFCRFLSPSIIGHFQEIKLNEGVSAEGWVVGCPVSLTQALRIHPDFLLRKLRESARLALDHGVGVIGLDTIDNVLLLRGLDPYRSLGLAATTGRALTLGGGLTVLRSSAFERGIDIVDDGAMVLGADTDAGSICARLWAREARRLTLVGRDRFKLETLRRRILAETGLSCKISSTLEGMGDIAVVIDSIGLGPSFFAGRPTAGAIVLSLGYLDNSPGGVQEYQSGGMVEATSNIVFIEGVDFYLRNAPGPGFRMPPYAAEACILAIEGFVKPPGPGRNISLHWVEKVVSMAKKHGLLPIQRTKQGMKP